ncbi:MAG: MFS transporter [Bryobacteraceae bacterium]
MPVSGSDKKQLVLGLLVLSALINFIDRGNLSVAAPVLGPEFKLTPVQLGVLFSAFFWTYSLCQIVTGLLADRYKASVLYGFGFLLWSAATLATGFAKGFGTLLAFRLLLGIGESTAFPAYSSLLANLLPENKRGFANALIDAAGKSGPALGTFAGGFVIAAWGWRSLFLILGVLSLLWLPPWFRYAPQQDKVATADERRDAPRLIEILAKRSAWATFIGLFGFNYGYFFLLSWLPSYLVTERHFSMRAMGVLAALPFAATAVSSTFFGWLSDRLISRGRSINDVRKSFVVSGLLLCALPLVMSAVVRNSLSIVLLVTAFTCIGLYSSNVWAITQTLAGPNAAGRWTGLQNAIANLGSLVAPIVTGFIVKQTGSFFLAFVVASVCMLISGAMYLFLVGRIAPIIWNAQALTETRPGHPLQGCRP